MFSTKNKALFGVFYEFENKITNVSCDVETTIK